MRDWSGRGSLSLLFVVGGDTLAIVPLSGNGLDLGFPPLEEMIRLSAVSIDMIDRARNSKFEQQSCWHSFKISRPGDRQVTCSHQTPAKPLVLRQLNLSATPCFFNHAHN